AFKNVLALPQPAKNLADCGRFGGHVGTYRFSAHVLPAVEFVAGWFLFSVLVFAATDQIPEARPGTHGLRVAECASCAGFGYGPDRFSGCELPPAPHHCGRLRPVRLETEPGSFYYAVSFQ